MRKNVIVFTLGDQRYALPIQVVERVIRAVSVTPLPQAPFPVLGVINIRGEIVPAISLYRLIGLPEGEIIPENEFLLVNMSGRRVVLPVNSVTGVMDYTEHDLTETDRILPRSELMEGVIRAPDGLIPIMNIEVFLPLEVGKCLEEALASSVAP